MVVVVVARVGVVVVVEAIAHILSVKHNTTYPSSFAMSLLGCIGLSIIEFVSLKLKPQRERMSRIVSFGSCGVGTNNVECFVAPPSAIYNHLWV